MDPRIPYSQNSSYLDLLNSQEGLFHENSPHDSFPSVINFGASQTSPFSSQPSEPTPHPADTPAERRERKRWTPADDEVLISAWLNTSKDPVIGNEQKSGSFWKRVGEYFANSGHGMEDGGQTDGVHCKPRWHKINDQCNKFCAAYASAERQNSSGHSENDVLKMAHEIYYSDHNHKFTLEHCWCVLRFEQKWLNLNTINKLNTPTAKGRTKRKTVDECSQSSNSSVGDFETRPEGVKAAKAKKNSAQGKALAEYKSLWEIRKVDMAEKEKLQKLAILDTILAKKEPLSETDETIKSKIVAQYF